MSGSGTYPAMRSEVIEAVRALADPAYQRTRWGVFKEGVQFYDDLSLNVHILYDDTMVLPTPRDAFPSVLRAEEVPAFEELESALGPMLDDLSADPDEVYLNDPRWAHVVAAAGRALELMERPNPT